MSGALPKPPPGLSALGHCRHLRSRYGRSDVDYHSGPAGQPLSELLYAGQTDAPDALEPHRTPFAELPQAGFPEPSLRRPFQSGQELLELSFWFLSFLKKNFSRNVLVYLGAGKAFEIGAPEGQDSTTVNSRPGGLAAVQVDVSVCAGKIKPGHSGR